MEQPSFGSVGLDVRRRPANAKEVALFRGAVLPASLVHKLALLDPAVVVAVKSRDRLFVKRVVSVRVCDRGHRHKLLAVPVVYLEAVEGIASWEKRVAADVLHELDSLLHVALVAERAGRTQPARKNQRVPAVANVAGDQAEALIVASLPLQALLEQEVPDITCLAVRVGRVDRPNVVEHTDKHFNERRVARDVPGHLNLPAAVVEQGVTSASCSASLLAAGRAPDRARRREGERSACASARVCTEAARAGTEPGAERLVWAAVLKRMAVNRQFEWFNRSLSY